MQGSTRGGGGGREGGRGGGGGRGRSEEGKAVVCVRGDYINRNLHLSCPCASNNGLTHITVPLLTLAAPLLEGRQQRQGSRQQVTAVHHQ